MATTAVSVLSPVASLVSPPSLKRRGAVEISSSFLYCRQSLQCPPLSFSLSQSAANARRGSGFLVACLPPAPKNASRASTRLYVSGNTSSPFPSLPFFFLFESNLLFGFILDSLKCLSWVIFSVFN